MQWSSTVTARNLVGIKKYKIIIILFVYSKNVLYICISQLKRKNMSNALLNSMVRGFGFTLGKKAANVVTSTRSTSTTSFNKKQMELIQTYEGIILNVQKIVEELEESYSNGKITKSEYELGKSQLNVSLMEATDELEKIKSVNPKKSVFWKITMFVVVIYVVLWAIKLIS